MGECKGVVSRAKCETAFTLLEAMIATMILGVVFSSILALISHSTRYLNDMRRTARSSQVLQQRMEDIRLMNWSQVQSLPSTFFDPNDTNHAYAGSVSRVAYDTYNGNTTISKVTLTVTWTNQANRVLTNTLSTLIANGGLNKYIL